jgi:UDP-N-acetylglucosamine 1-carboxyvinyltransferase
MNSLVIHGGHPLDGDIIISGAKNAALPIIAATILTAKPVSLSNVPSLKDIQTMMSLLKHLGSGIEFDKDSHQASFNLSHIASSKANDDCVKKMRASILVLGPLLARTGSAQVSLPGGCAIGSRPVDLHLKALKKMGATISQSNGHIKATVTGGRLHGAEITFDKVTVTGTENILMAAVLASGQTVVNNAAREPEVADLAYFLNSLGAKIQGIGTNRLVIDGVEALGGGHYSILPDRIETGTYLIAAAMTRGHIRVKAARPETLLSLLEKLKDAGAEITVGDDWIELDMKGARPKAVSIETAPYPGFPTDMQAQILALNSVASGQAQVVENIFENRFMHVQELNRLGSHISLHGNKATSEGVDHLEGASVTATDLRASACLVLAGLVASGETVVEHIFHLDRGYEDIEDKLTRLGANIKRVENCDLASVKES